MQEALHSHSGVSTVAMLMTLMWVICEIPDASRTQRQVNVFCMSFPLTQPLPHPLGSPSIGEDESSENLDQKRLSLGPDY